MAGSCNFEADGKLATYLPWLMPWGKPVTLLADSPEQLAAAQRELVRVGIDRPAAAATGTPQHWVRPGETPVSLRRAVFKDLAAVREAAGRGDLLVVRASGARSRGACELLARHGLAARQAAPRPHRPGRPRHHPGGLAPRLRKPVRPPRLTEHQSLVGA